MKRWKKRVRALVRRGAAERELAEEMAFHLEMEARENGRSGMSPEEARRQAAIAFGGVEKHKEEVRDARWLGWAPGMSLDLRLGARMLVKHPALTLVGGLGMAVAIALGAVFHASAAVVHATLPFAEGERIVAIESWNVATDDPERRILHDLAAWRAASTVREVSAYRDVGRNLIVPGGATEPVPVAEMTASGFRLARVPPLVGRYLLDDDERPGAPSVVVIGHGVWRTHFGGDPGAIGRAVRLGNEVHTVVGVMPDGFAFPVSHRIWVPLRAQPSAHARRKGPDLQAFARLAPGATLQSAQAELTALGRRSAAAFPDTDARLRPRVVPYTAQPSDDMHWWEIPFTRVLLTLLLLVVCVNVAVLVYARTAMRAGEITVRSALGASRARIVAQLFAEALVLAAGAALVGLVVAGFAIRRLDSLAEEVGRQMGGLPFWMHFRLSAGTVLYVAGLAVLAAVVVGVVPALRATGTRLESSLRELGGGTGMRMGRTWTVLIVAQVAFAVAALPAAVFHAAEFLRYGVAEPGFPAEEYLTAGMMMEADAVPGASARDVSARFADRQLELARRLREQPEVAGVAFASERPGNGRTARIEVRGVAAPPSSAPGHAVRVSRVDTGFFATFDVATVAGRSFYAGDLASGARGVVVNRSFARDLLGGGNAVGRLLRYVGEDGSGVGETGSWFEVVGVVDDLPRNAVQPGEPAARVYHPLAPGAIHPVNVTVRVRGASPASFTPRLMAIAGTVDPALQLHEVVPLDQALRQLQTGMRMGGLALGLITLSVLLLSAAGIYALMSFTVTRRRREIGIRAALGANPRRILRTVFSRAARQLAAGGALGLAIATGIDFVTRGELTGGKGIVVLPGVAALMLVVGLLAVMGPSRRGLRIEPMEALREE
jgi:predicted permease